MEMGIDPVESQNGRESSTDGQQFAQGSHGRTYERVDEVRGAGSFGGWKWALPREIPE